MSSRKFFTVLSIVSLRLMRTFTLLYDLMHFLMVFFVCFFFWRGVKRVGKMWDIFYWHTQISKRPEDFRKNWEWTLFPRVSVSGPVQFSTKLLDYLPSHGQSVAIGSRYFGSALKISVKELEIFFDSVKVPRNERARIGTLLETRLDWKPKIRMENPMVYTGFHLHFQLGNENYWSIPVQQSNYGVLLTYLRANSLSQCTV